MEAGEVVGGARLTSERRERQAYRELLAEMCPDAGDSSDHVLAGEHHEARYPHVRGLGQREPHAAGHVLGTEGMPDSHALARMDGPTLV